MILEHRAAYESYGLSTQVEAQLARLGDLVLGAAFNITGLSQPEQIELQHFLDSLSLLQVPGIDRAQRLADIGSGGGFPALVLAIAIPHILVLAIESQSKKCEFIAHAASELRLSNVTVICARAEDLGRSDARESQDIVVSRAVAQLPVVAEYSIPLLRVGGLMVAMKGQISNQERIQASKALGILGAGDIEAFRLDPFEGSFNRWAYVAKKIRPTPEGYPRRSGIPAKRPLGA